MSHLPGSGTPHRPRTPIATSHRTGSGCGRPPSARRRLIAAGIPFERHRMGHDGWSHPVSSGGEGFLPFAWLGKAGIPASPKSRPSQSRRCPPTPSKPTAVARPAGSGERLADAVSPPPTGATPRTAYARALRSGERPSALHQSPTGTGSEQLPPRLLPQRTGRVGSMAGRNAHRLSGAVFNAGSCTRPRRRTSNCR